MEKVLIVSVHQTFYLSINNKKLYIVFNRFNEHQRNKNRSYNLASKIQTTKHHVFNFLKMLRSELTKNYIHSIAITAVRIETKSSTIKRFIVRPPQKSRVKSCGKTVSFDVLRQKNILSMHNTRTQLPCRDHFIGISSLLNIRQKTKDLQCKKLFLHNSIKLLNIYPVQFFILFAIIHMQVYCINSKYLYTYNVDTFII